MVTSRHIFLTEEDLSVQPFDHGLTTLLSLSPSLSLSLFLSLSSRTSFCLFVCLFAGLTDSVRLLTHSPGREEEGDGAGDTCCTWMAPSRPPCPRPSFSLALEGSWYAWYEVYSQKIQAMGYSSCGTSPEPNRTRSEISSTERREGDWL